MPPAMSTFCPLKTSAKMTSSSTGNITVKKTDAGLRQNDFWS